MNNNPEEKLYLSVAFCANPPGKNNVSIESQQQRIITNNKDKKIGPKCFFEPEDWVEKQQQEIYSEDFPQYQADPDYPYTEDSDYSYQADSDQNEDPQYKSDRPLEESINEEVDSFHWQSTPKVLADIRIIKAIRNQETMEQIGTLTVSCDHTGQEIILYDYFQGTARYITQVINNLLGTTFDVTYITARLHKTIPVPSGSYARVINFVRSNGYPLRVSCEAKTQEILPGSLIPLKANELQDKEEHKRKGTQ